MKEMSIVEREMRQIKPMKRPIQTFQQNTKIYHGDEEVSPKKLQSFISPKKTTFYKKRRGSHPSIFRYLYLVRPQNNLHRIYKTSGENPGNACRGEKVWGDFTSYEN